MHVPAARAAVEYVGVEERREARRAALQRQVQKVVVPLHTVAAHDGRVVVGGDERLALLGGGGLERRQHALHLDSQGEGALRDE